MLRTHCGSAWRLFVAFLFYLLLCSSAARGTPIKPPTPIPPPTSTYAISGDVYGLNGGTAQVELLQNGTELGAPVSTTGYYDFTGLTLGDTYTLEQYPLLTGYQNSSGSIGYFQYSSLTSSVSGTMAAPSGALVSSSGSAISNITLPSTTPSGTGSYAYVGVNYNFADSASTVVTPTGSVTLPPSRPIIPVGSVGVTSTSSMYISDSVAVVGGNNRFLAGPGSVLNLTGTVANNGTHSSNWQLSLVGGMSFTPTSGMSLASGGATTFVGTVNGAAFAPGVQTDIVWVTPITTINQPAPGAQSRGAYLTIDPVLSRGSDPTSQLQVSGATLGRIMAGATATTAISVASLGASASYTNLTMNSGSYNAADSSGDVFAITNAAPTTYNGTTTTNSGATAFNATFASSLSGSTTGTVAIPVSSELFTGEKLASGSPTLPTLSVPYTATVLQPRQVTAAAGQAAINLTAGAAAGGLLCGAVVPVNTGYAVMSSSDSNHVTNVWVTGSANAVWTSDGATPVGQVTVTPTLVNSAGNVTVPVSIAALSMGQYSGSASLSVVTAEATSVHDNTNYAPVPLAYSVSNVGYAATGGLVSGGTQQLFGAPLSAPITAGSTIASFTSANSYLTSSVAYVGTSGTASSYANSPNTSTIISSGTVTKANMFGTVGSQCDILDSTAGSSGTTVTMAWRNRNSLENGSMLSTSPSLVASQFPSGVQWLTSDVVNIGGVAGNQTVAMEMTFDDGINQLLDSSGSPGTISGSYIAEWNGSAWQKATSLNVSNGTAEVQGYSGTLSAFLQQYEVVKGDSLSQLAGSWGVALNPGGVATSWAIVNGLNQNGAQFAVVPEPSTFVLLGTGVAGLLIYRGRRRGRRKVV